MNWTTQLLFVFISVVACEEKIIKEGDSCTLKTTNQIGRCTHLSRCAVLLEKALQGISPQVCFLSGTAPVVCCPPVNSNTTRSSGPNAVGECQTEKKRCRDNQRCENNSDGGFTCHCDHGFRTTVEGDCMDIDECNDMLVCRHFGTCINTVGSYTCECSDGLASSLSSQQRCHDIDECLPNGGLGNCQQKCVNLWGTYRCECHSGFRLASDTRTCIDINECSEEEMQARLCTGLCVNTLGSYRCTCPKGYRMGDDKRTCIDINECEESGHLCTEDQLCLNIRGGARCNSIVCPDGYFRHPGDKKRCDHETCRKDDSACNQKPLMYTYDFITFLSKLNISSNGRPQLDIFKLKGPNGTQPWFSLSLLDSRAPLEVELATSDYFKLTTQPQGATISLVKPITGPQEITLVVEILVYRARAFLGTTLAKIMIFVSEYDF